MDKTSPAPERKGRPGWEKDMNSVGCNRCLQEFTMLKRRHHCRSCGKLFCSTCCYELIQLPASYEYETPQRVCEDCKLSLQEEEKKKKERYDEDVLTAQFYLRSSTCKFVEAHPDIGSRKFKSFFTVRKEGHEILMTMLPASTSIYSLLSESKKNTVFSLLAALRHPFILPVLSIDYYREKQRLLVFREISPKGSLKDRIYKSIGLRKSFEEKYKYSKGGKAIRGQSLPEKEIQRYGSQILQVLIFLRTVGYSFPHLHSGNVIINNDNNCCLTDLENCILNYEPYYLPYFSSEEKEKLQKNIEVVCFGHILFEMVLGFEKGTKLLKEFKTSCPSEIYSVLELIFPNEGVTSATLEDLLTHSFFSSIQKHGHPEISITKKIKTLIDLSSESMGKILAGEKIQKQQTLVRVSSNEEIAQPSSHGNSLKKKKTTKKLKVETATNGSIPLAPTSNSNVPPPPPPPSGVPPPPPPPANVPPITSERSALLESIRNPNNLKQLKKVSKK